MGQPVRMLALRRPRLPHRRVAAAPQGVTGPRPCHALLLEVLCLPSSASPRPAVVDVPSSEYRAALRRHLLRSYLLPLALSAGTADAVPRASRCAVEQSPARRIPLSTSHFWIPSVAGQSTRSAAGRGHTHPERRSETRAEHRPRPSGRVPESGLAGADPVVRCEAGHLPPESLAPGAATSAANRGGRNYRCAWMPSPPTCRGYCGNCNGSAVREPPGEPDVPGTRIDAAPRPSSTVPGARPQRTITARRMPAGEDAAR